MSEAWASAITSTLGLDHSSAASSSSPRERPAVPIDCQKQARPLELGLHHQDGQALAGAGRGDGLRVDGVGPEDRLRDGVEGVVVLGDLRQPIAHGDVVGDGGHQHLRVQQADAQAPLVASGPLPRGAQIVEVHAHHAASEDLLRLGDVRVGLVDLRKLDARELRQHLVRGVHHLARTRRPPAAEQRDQQLGDVERALVVEIAPQHDGGQRPQRTRFLPRERRQRRAERGNRRAQQRVSQAGLELHQQRVDAGEGFGRVQDLGLPLVAREPAQASQHDASDLERRVEVLGLDHVLQRALGRTQCREAAHAQLGALRQVPGGGGRSGHQASSERSFSRRASTRARSVSDSPLTSRLWRPSRTC